MLNLHYKTVSSAQRDLLERLGRLEFGTLVGGTALALQIGHRRSYDLDFVTKEAISDEMMRRIKSEVSEYNLSQRLFSPTQFTAFVGNVKITYFQDIASLLHPVHKLGMFNLASIGDIFSSKLYIMGRRATWRDYVDVAVCLDQGACSLEKRLPEATTRYQVSSRWILDPLSYFDDLELTPIEWGEKEYSDDQIKQIITKNVRDYLKTFNIE
ncbi:MAG: hypothetical protein COZ34_00320 [Candidatus Pacebacteria bacterium CG_4_10_14_3_um_filter_34_15]|nr:MAG: hypothetical protein COZ34_00320 [Candidatus Pacebacteria bacterium CG_4_10_14_3_um_filter_34_15]